MDAIKIQDKKNTLMVAHRGLSGLECENTAAAFIAAGNRSYFGIECDVHKTLDGKFVVIHDDHTGRVCDQDLSIEGSTFDALATLRLNSRYGKSERNDLRIPALSDYISICTHYEKTAVLELKNAFSKDDIAAIMQIIRENGDLDKVIIISFHFDNLLLVRNLYPNQKVQYLTSKFTDDLISTLVEHKMDLDIRYTALDDEKIRLCHENGILVNTWTVDDPTVAQRLIDAGIDYITSNILE